MSCEIPIWNPLSSECIVLRRVLQLPNLTGTYVDPPPHAGSPLPSGSSPAETLLDVKSSLGKLSIPEEPKVSHGDENLSVGDFLSAAAKRSAEAGNSLH